MKGLFLTAALACGIAFASQAKTAVKPAVETKVMASHSGNVAAKKVAFFQLEQPTVVEYEICGHYGWIAYYNEAQKQERIDYIVATYCN